MYTCMRSCIINTNTWTVRKLAYQNEIQVSNNLLDICKSLPAYSPSYVSQQPDSERICSFNLITNISFPNLVGPDVIIFT